MMAFPKAVGAASSLTADSGCFDIWRDYMNLSKALETLRDRCDRNQRGTDGDKKAPLEPWVQIQSSHREDCKMSPETISSNSSSSSSISSRTGFSSDLCRFCKQNGESASVYRSHKLKAADGRVICPILRNYTCPICEATGNHAHTRRYCPQLQRQEVQRKLSGSW